MTQPRVLKGTHLELENPSRLSGQSPLSEIRKPKSDEEPGLDSSLLLLAFHLLGKTAKIY